MSIKYAKIKDKQIKLMEELDVEYIEFVDKNIVPCNIQKSACAKTKHCIKCLALISEHII